ncbi:MAG TPA: hypothetical protein VGL25_15220 [Casimicrobiaceae bacterium]|jgi:hypothetical protein
MTALYRLCCRALIVGAFALPLCASASVPTLADCLEASDFIANAALSRDNGMTRDAFISRLTGDFAAIRAFPAELRWFVRDEDDERFLEDAAEHVFDVPSTPADHRREFLQACFERLTI